MRRSARIGIMYFTAVMLLIIMLLIPNMAYGEAVSAGADKISLDAEVETDKTQIYGEALYTEIYDKDTVVSEEVDMNQGMVVAIPDEYISVFSEPDKNSEKIGRMYADNIATVIEQGDDWTKVVTGNLTGYVRNQWLAFGEEAKAIGFDGDYGMTKEEVAEFEAAKAEAARKEAEARAAKIAEAMKKIDVTYNPTMTVSEDEVWLLACVIDWEAAWECYEGKLAVANVVLNRVRSSSYPNTITKVIYQNYQFSGVSNGAGGPSERFKVRINNGPRNEECLKAAMDALSGKNNVGNYIGFRPQYNIKLDNLSSFTIIGNHVFF